MNPDYLEWLKKHLIPPKYHTIFFTREEVNSIWEAAVAKEHEHQQMENRKLQAQFNELALRAKIDTSNLAFMISQWCPTEERKP